MTNNHTHDFTVIDLTDYGHELARNNQALIKKVCRCDLIVSDIGRYNAVLYTINQSAIEAFEDVIGHDNVVAYEIVSYEEPEPFNEFN